jgi:hypothetical protein
MVKSRECKNIKDLVICKEFNGYFQKNLRGPKFSGENEGFHYICEESIV